uniref:28S ribosomal protein S9, mitochondrial n=1 Tax=Rhabditophanes sp. KR3021 TaxID=114890 RepID=A0AC35U1Q6_9BILA
MQSCLKLAFCKNVLLTSRSNIYLSAASLATENASTQASASLDADFAQSRRLKGIGKALNTYISRAKDNARMMAKESADFELGKRHLANIMGLDANAMTQADIDRSIQYLFPSGLTDKQALPVMKPPQEILPKFYKLEFDDEGRPLDSLFFTLKPKFYSLLSDIGEKTRKLIAYKNPEGQSSKLSKDLILTGSSWISKDKLSKRIGDAITDEMYAHWLMAFDYLASLPSAYIESEFIMSYRDQMASGTDGKTVFGPQIPQVVLDTVSKKRFATAETQVKSTFAKAIVNDAGSGKYIINGHSYDCFRSLLARETLIAPLIVADVLGKVDIEVTTSGDGGLSAVPRAVRHAVALGIAAIYPQQVERLRISGLLTSDPRRKERSKVNQPGARAKWIWKRR